VEWQTRRSQKPLEITLRGGSTPPLGTQSTMLCSKVMKYFVILCLLICMVFITIHPARAQTTPTAISSTTSTASANATQNKKQVKQVLLNINEITNPEQDKQKNEILKELNQKRNTAHVSFINVIPFAIVYAINAGVPTNTIVLILLLPLLATIVVAFRYIVGLSGIGLLVPIALSITLLATDVTPGFIMLAAIIVASLVSRFFLRRFPIMQMPKVALSMLMVAIFLLLALTISSIYGIIDVRNLSIFPILLFILLSDRIVTIFLERDFIETIQTTVITLFLAILGFLLLTWEQLRVFTLIYPEWILLLIPINIMVGRYFGLRVTEYIKFQPVLRHGNK
jgi:hypothetical protein